MSVRRRAVLLVLASLLLATGAVTGITAPAGAATPQVYGRITDASTHRPVSRIKVLLFDADWNYLRSVNAGTTGIYTIASPGPGTYHLQLVDRRPAYDVNAYARRLDVPVSIATSPVRKNITVRRGGSIGGSISVHGHRGARATVRAVSDAGQVYEVGADDSGRYALGGLAVDDYRVFAYDAKKAWVGPSRKVHRVASRSFHPVSFDLRTPASAYRGFLTLGGNPATRSSVTVTAVNQRTGEYWVQKVTHGDLMLRGLTAGAYTLKVPNTNGYFGKTFTLPHVSAGQEREVNVDLPVPGGTFVGTVIDDTTGKPIKNASVRLTDAADKTQAEVTTTSTGTFEIGGSQTAQTGVTIRVFTYDVIDGHTYVPLVIAAQSITDDIVVDLHVLRLVRIATPPTV